jgi:hypothetical protein
MADRTGQSKKWFLRQRQLGLGPEYIKLSPKKYRYDWPRSWEEFKQQQTVMPSA